MRLFLLLKYQESTSRVTYLNNAPPPTFTFVTNTGGGGHVTFTLFGTLTIHVTCLIDVEIQILWVVVFEVGLVF